MKVEVKIVDAEESLTSVINCTKVFYPTKFCIDGDNVLAIE